MFRPPAPPKVGTPQLLRETEEVIALGAALTCEQKALVEFMRDGPRSTGQSGHWLRFAQMVATRDKLQLHDELALYFTIANVALDAFIAAWDAKRAYDSSRPWTLIHHYFKGKQITGWSGPGGGVTALLGEQWRPYSPATFVTPPFPGFVSGHSCVSAACAEALRQFTGSDMFGATEVRVCGVLTQEPHGEQVRLALPTFSATAAMAGRSRVLGGYHIETDNQAGLALGLAVAKHVMPQIQRYYRNIGSACAPARAW
jgi:hypothetical protein